LGVALLEQGQAHEAAECFRRAVALKPDFLVAHSNLLCTLLFCPGCDAATIFEEHRRFNQLHAEPLANLIRPHENDRTPDRRLRIGYVSPDFREHCQSYFTVPLFAAHDREMFEIFCYSDVAKPDHVTARVRSLADAWRSITGLSDQDVADLIRQDEIDTLVDLTMHMEDNRVLLFARKPAPVQVCWLAYPGTTGLTTMDYRLTDPYLDPPGLFDRFYSESSVRLPETFWCYDRPADELDVGPLPALRNGHITFGSLNTFYKMNDALLDLWASVLNAVKGSRIILLAPVGSARGRVLELFAGRGVAPERVTFVGRAPRAQYLEYYNQIDIGLDTIPYNGHTTSMDSFWMGVPVVTLVGQTVVGRAGICLLTNLGLPKLIAQTAEQYVQIAAELAADTRQLAELRAGLRDRMASSPLMDAPRFARGVESAFRDMWRKWCGSES
jgi:predicted O-linked N-acetylglucosamine transferase (SPINDLY family)